MAGDDKTEKPTGKRKGEARRKGQVAKSTELNGALVLVAGLVAISFMGPKIVSSMAGAMRALFAAIAKPNEVSSAAGLHGVVSLVLHTLETTAMPIGVICMAGGVLANVAQVGLRPTPYLLKPDFKRLNPVHGAKQIFGKRVPFELGKVLAKVTVVGAAAAMTLIPLITHLGASMGTTPMALGSLLNDSAKSIIERVVIVYLLIAVIDLVYQRRKMAKSMKMTKQEVKDEGRQTDLPPEIKGGDSPPPDDGGAGPDDGRDPDRGRGRHQPDPLRRRAPVRRRPARPRRGGQGQEPGGRPDQADRH